MSRKSRKQRAKGEAPAGDAVESDKRAHILLAEDDREMCRLVAMVLNKEGYNVTMCNSGINLVSHLTADALNVGGDHFDLVISDIRMPGISGMEVLEGLKGGLDGPPVILITAFGDAETHAAADRLGAVAVLDKPFNMDALVRIVRSTLPRELQPPAKH